MTFMNVTIVVVRTLVVAVRDVKIFHVMIEYFDHVMLIEETVTLYFHVDIVWVSRIAPGFSEKI